MTRRKITAAQREKFEMYLFEMDDVLEAFLEEAGAAGFHLDYSLQSLDLLEEYWLAVSPQAEDPERIRQQAARYYGEVFRLNYGGKWRLSEKHPRDIYFGLPVICGFDPKAPDYEFCPLVTFHNFTVNQHRGLLRRAAELEAGSR